MRQTQRDRGNESQPVARHTIDKTRADGNRQRHAQNFNRAHIADICQCKATIVDQCAKNDWQHGQRLIGNQRGKTAGND